MEEGRGHPFGIHKERDEYQWGRSQIIRSLDVGRFVEVPLRPNRKNDRTSWAALCSRIGKDFDAFFIIRQGTEVGKIIILRTR